MSDHIASNASCMADILFRRRLEKSLRYAHERLNEVVREQITLLERRKELLDEVLHRAQNIGKWSSTEEVVADDNSKESERHVDL